MDNVLDNVEDNAKDSVVDKKLTGTEPGTVDTDSRTFSQEEVNNIIRDRLAKEKDKAEKHLETITQEYKKKELNSKAKELLSSKGLSLDILDILKFDDEDMLNKNLLILEGAINPGQKEDHVDQAEHGIKFKTAGTHGSVQHTTTDSSIKAAMGLK